MGLCNSPRQKNNVKKLNMNNDPSKNQEPPKIKNEKNIQNLYNQSSLKDKNFNTLQISNVPENKINNTFPIGTTYEKELNTNFKYFNVFWYNPNISNDIDLDLFKKCFENVQFFKGNDLMSIINFFKKESIYEWIVVTPGFQGEELIKNLENFECIKSFFVYCGNPNYHQWVNKRKKVGCITSDPKVLCQKLIELNKSYIIPNFNYKIIANNNIILNSNKDNNPKGIFNSSLKLVIESKNRAKNKYNIFCVKLLNYLKEKESIKDTKETFTDGNSPFNIMKNAAGVGDIPEQLKLMFSLKINDDLKNLCLLSLYFSKFPYLLNLLSFQEIKDLLKIQLTPNMIYIAQSKLETIMDELCKKIMKNECILDDKDKLKEMQIYLIHVLPGNIRIFLGDSSILINYYQIINFLRDIDFCLKLYMLMSIYNINNKKHNFAYELLLSLLVSETRFAIYFNHLFLILQNKISKSNEAEQKLLNDTLSIKDFIVSGDTTFLFKIKPIEKYIKKKSFKYINVEGISNYLDQKRMEIGEEEIVPYFYFLIITFEEYQKNWKNIVQLSYKSGITFLVFLYIENEDIKEIPKNMINYLISTILVYSPQDIINYLSEKLNFCGLIDAMDMKEFFQIKIPKINYELNAEDLDIYQNGGFELAETFDTNLINNNFILKISEDIDYSTEFTKNIYYIYKEHNALNLFYTQNCPYFGWKLYPELNSFNICFVKRFLYMYCREEKESQKSLYRIVNKDLSSRNPHKISRYINILALINKFIESKNIISFNGIVYRGTFLNEKLIMSLAIGTKMVNTQFWSTSKDVQIAKNFLMNSTYKNTFIICKEAKTNIDIDFEKLYTYKNEKEVLFLPYTEFKVEKVSTQIYSGKKIFIIEMIELGHRNYVNIDFMQVEDVNNLAEKKILEKIILRNKRGFENVMSNFFNELD